MEANSDKAYTNSKTDVYMKGIFTMVTAMGSVKWPSAKSNGTKGNGN